MALKGGKAVSKISGLIIAFAHEPFSVAWNLIEGDYIVLFMQESSHSEHGRMVAIWRRWKNSSNDAIHSYGFDEIQFILDLNRRGEKMCDLLMVIDSVLK